MNIATLPMDWLTAFMQRFSMSACPGLLPPLWGWKANTRAFNLKLVSAGLWTAKAYWNSQRSHQVFVQIGHLFLQLRGFDVGIRHSHHHHTPAATRARRKAFHVHVTCNYQLSTCWRKKKKTHTPAQVVWEIDALAHLSSDNREQQSSREPSGIHSAPLIEWKEETRT